MEESWEYYTKWNKADREGQEPYNFTHMWNKRQKATNEQREQTNKLIDTENRIGITRGEG